MFENIYTTKMSANRKKLQNRFSKIRSKSGRFSKMMALVMSVILVVTVLCGTVVMALMNTEYETDSSIQVFYKENPITFENKPFFLHKTVYLPLFELCDAIGLSEKSEIIRDGDVIYFNIENHGNSYEIRIGNNAIIYRYFGDGNDRIAETLTPYSPVLKDGIVYIPFDYIDWIFNRYNDTYDVSFIYQDINTKTPYHGNIEGMTYPYICDLQYQVDNGHFPWRLSPELVVTATLGEGTVSMIEQGKTECKALYTANGKTYTVQLTKPVQKDEFGIWIVQSFKEMEEF